MRIGLDVTDAAVPAPTGVGLHAAALARALAEHAPEHRYLACLRLRASTLRRGASGIGPLRQVRYWDRFAPLLSRRLDVFHGTGRVVRLPRVRQVVTLHDVMHLVRGDYADPDGRARRLAQYREIERRADAVIVPSAFSRTEVIAGLGLPSERLHVVPLAPAPDFAPRRLPDAELLREQGVEGPYVLFVGTISERKNVLRLLQALGSLPGELKLVLAGSVRESFRDAVDEAAAPFAKRIVRLGYVPGDVLPSLYAGARAFAFPSEYEGFGIPVLEAMACGCPVVAANAAALPEVAGEAALLCEPGSVESIADALRRAVSDGSEREKLVSRGLARASEFSYARTARATAAVYEAVAG